MSRSHASLRILRDDNSSVVGDDISTSSTITSLTNGTEPYSLMSRSSRLRRRTDVSVITMSSTSNSVVTGATSESRATEHYDSLLIRINHALQIIDDVLVPSTIQKLVRRDRILKCEKLILNIMGGVAGSGLNYILARVKLGEFIRPHVAVMLCIDLSVVCSLSHRIYSLCIVSARTYHLQDKGSSQ